MLAALPEQDRARLLAATTTVRLETGRALYEPRRPISQVYFPLGGLVSLLSHGEGGRWVEVGLVGPEGMVGLPVFLGAGSVPFRAVCQVGGLTRSLPVAAFRDAAAPGGALAAVLQRYAWTQLVQATQSAACNRLHSAEQRLARWLLGAQDRLGGDRVPVTQEFLAAMLGVRRASVTVAAGTLEGAGLIRRRRGAIVVVDRAGLERAACACYRLIREEHERVLG